MPITKLYMHPTAIQKSLSRILNRKQTTRSLCISPVLILSVSRIHKQWELVSPVCLGFRSTSQDAFCHSNRIFQRDLGWCVSEVPQCIHTEHVFSTLCTNYQRRPGNSRCQLLSSVHGPTNVLIVCRRLSSGRQTISIPLSR